ncbi:hypothetical protein V8C43DRAFT_288697 [Trichoderma afarasin]
MFGVPHESQLLVPSCPSMTCRCASLNVYGFYLAWPLTRCVCEGAFAPPLVGVSFFSFHFLLFFFSFNSSLSLP